MSIFLTLCFWCTSLSLLGQTKNNSSSTTHNTTQSTFQELINSLNKTADKHRFAPLQYNQNLHSLVELYNIEIPDSVAVNSIAADEDRLISLQQNLLKEDLGLSLQAGYLENFEADIFSIGEIYYKRRGQVELKWDLLKNGLFENRHKAKALTLKQKVLQYSSEKDNLVKSYEQRYNLIIYLFNKRRIALLERYISLQNTFESCLAQLTNQHYTLKDKLITEKLQTQRLHQKLKAYQAYNQNVVFNTIPFKVEAFPVVDIDLSKLKSAQNPLQENLAQLKANTESSYNPLYEIRLSLFGRYSLYGAGNEQSSAAIPPPLETIGGREYFSAGLNLSIPLPFNASEKREMQRLKQKIETAKLAKQDYSDRKTIINTYYEYEFTLQQYIQFYGKYLLNQEKIRQLSTLHSLNDEAYSPLEFVDLIAQRYRIVLALIDLKQELALKLLKINVQVDLPILEYVTPIQLPPQNESATTFYDVPKKDIPIIEQKPVISDFYIWTEGFSTVSNHKLLNVLKRYNVKSVSITLGNNTFDKLANFIKEAHQSNITVNLLVGNNTLIYIDTRRQKLAHYIQQATKLSADGLHLDVEPHSFIDWKEKEKFYKTKFIQLLTIAQKEIKTKGLKLIISIPHYYDEILPEIKSLADQINLMVYETNRIDQIQKRITDDIKLLKSKATIALRASDFKDMNQLFKTIGKLKKRFPGSHFAIHDWRSFQVKINGSYEK